MNPNTDLDLWIEMLRDEYPGLSREHYRIMKNTAAIYYYFGPDDDNWNLCNAVGGTNEDARLFERFLVYRSLKTTHESEY